MFLEPVELVAGKLLGVLLVGQVAHLDRVSQLEQAASHIVRVVALIDLW